MRSLLVATLMVGLALVTPARADFSDYFLVQNFGDGPATLDTVVTWGKHDLPGLTGPTTGFQVSHSVFWPSNHSYVLQTFSSAPFKSFRPDNGDGGQLLYLDSARVTGVETRDGGNPLNQYFAPAGCPVDGWLFFQPDSTTSGRWGLTVAKLVDVPQPTGNCSAPTSAYTRWRSEMAQMFFLWSGVPSWRTVWVIIAEHYAGPSIAASSTMERDYFAAGYGWIRWEGWTTNLGATQDVDLLGRCPGVYVKGGAWPMAEPATGWIQTACRSWTNIMWDGDGMTTVRDISWPP